MGHFLPKLGTKWHAQDETSGMVAFGVGDVEKGLLSLRNIR